MKNGRHQTKVTWKKFERRKRKSDWREMRDGDQITEQLHLKQDIERKQDLLFCLQTIS